jgi:hypothetical protein
VLGNFALAAACSPIASGRSLHRDRKDSSPPDGPYYCVVMVAEVVRQNRLRENADVPSSVYKTKFRWDVSARRDGEYFRVFYWHHYPKGVEESRDTHRFSTLAEAEKFAETMRQVERFYRNPG